MSLKIGDCFSEIKKYDPNYYFSFLMNNSPVFKKIRGDKIAFMTHENISLGYETECVYELDLDKRKLRIRFGTFLNPEFVEYSIKSIYHMLYNPKTRDDMILMWCKEIVTV